MVHHNKYMSYKIKTFSYPTLPSKKAILERRDKILNNDRKNKIVFIGSFKLALNKYGSYFYRYKIIKGLTSFPKFFSLYGFNWDKKQIPFDLICIALIDIDTFWIPQSLINCGFVAGFLCLICIGLFNNKFIDFYLLVKGLSSSAISFLIFESLRTLTDLEQSSTGTVKVKLAYFPSSVIF